LCSKIRLERGDRIRVKEVLSSFSCISPCNAASPSDTFSPLEKGHYTLASDFCKDPGPTSTSRTAKLTETPISGFQEVYP
jgi:hypothetical protein